MGVTVPEKKVRSYTEDSKDRLKEWSEFFNQKISHLDAKSDIIQVSKNTRQDILILSANSNA